VPELPEVETIRRQLRPRLRGRQITEAWAFPSPKFDQAVRAVGDTFGEVERRGKYLLCRLTPGTIAPHDRAEPPTSDGPPSRELVVHLGMTGRLVVRPGGLGDGPDSPHRRAAWSLDDGTTLEFIDVRRFGRIAVVPVGRYGDLPTLAALGPEPFGEDFDPEALRRVVNASRRALKTQLLSQRPVAGLGNIYADEALWRAGVHPRARRLTRAQAGRLRDAIRDVLDAGIADGGTTLRDYRDARGDAGGHQARLECYGRAGLPCRRCGATLRRTVVDARTTTFCPTCQRR
jgi:formamidopyrimidine-DNA glycosylase